MARAIPSLIESTAKISHLTAWIRSCPNKVVILILSAMAAGILFVDSGILAFLVSTAAAGLIAVRYWEAMRTLDWGNVDEWVRAQIAAIVIRDWYSPSQAAEMFCDPVVVREWQDARAHISSSIMEMVREQGRKVGGSAGADPLHGLETPMSTRLSGQLPELNGSQGTAQERYKQNNRMLRDELVRQLIAGVLVAKGSPVRAGDGHGFEHAIPSSLWQHLMLDIRNSEASGRGRRYGAVSIGKKRLVWRVENDLRNMLSAVRMSVSDTPAHESKRD